MPEEKQVGSQVPAMPKLDLSFFAVCQSAIKNCAWKREDFNKVQRVEGLLNALYLFWASNEPALHVPAPSEQVIEKVADAPELPVSEAKQDAEPIVEVPEVKIPSDVPVAAPANTAGIITPEQAKEVPVRPMPDDIREIVEAGVEVAKNPPKVRNVEVTDLPSDPDAARNAFNKPF